MAMNQRRWVGVALSAAWLAGITGYELSTWQAARKSVRAVVTPVCQQADQADRGKCVISLSDFYLHLAARHAIEIVGLSILACLLGWVAGMLVIKRLAGSALR